MVFPTPSPLQKRINQEKSLVNLRIVTQLFPHYFFGEGSERPETLFLVLGRLLFIIYFRYYHSKANKTPPGNSSAHENNSVSNKTGISVHMLGSLPPDKKNRLIRRVTFSSNIQSQLMIKTCMHWKIKIEVGNPDHSLSASFFPPPTPRLFLEKKNDVPVGERCHILLV